MSSSPFKGDSRFSSEQIFSIFKWVKKAGSLHLCCQTKHWKTPDGELANVPENITPVRHLCCYNFFQEETLYLFQTYLLVYVSSLLLQLNAYCLILLSSVTNIEPDKLVHLITEVHKYSERLNRQPFGFNVSHWRTHQTPSVKAVEQMTPSMCTSVPYEPDFYSGVRKKVKGQIMPQKKQDYHCASKTGRGTTSTGHFPLVTVEQLE